MKWINLVLYALVALVSQMLWLNFAPIGPSLQKMYGVDEFTATLPVFVFPLFYVLLSINAGAMVDKKGYKKIISFGAVLMSIGSLVRIVDDFWVMFAGQCLIAIAQPYIINGINKLVADWFSEKEAGGAVGMGTAGMFLGMFIGVGATVPLIDATSYQTMNIIMAGTCVLFCLLFMVVVKENKKTDGSVASSVGGLKDYGQLLKNKNILVINVLSFLSLGFFNGLFSSISLILGEQGLNEEQSGMVGAALIGAGILGAIVIPIISDKIGKRKIFMILAAITATALCYPLMTSGDYNMALLLAAVVGLVFLPGYAILLTAGEEESGKAKAGASTGLIMLSGNFGGVVVIMAMEMIKGEGSWRPSVFFCVGVLVLAVIFSFILKETYKKAKA